LSLKRERKCKKHKTTREQYNRKKQKRFEKTINIRKTKKTINIWKQKPAIKKDVPKSNNQPAGRPKNNDKCA